MENKKEQERMVLNMKDAGCSADTINRFLLCYYAGDIKGELKVLSSHRQALLDEVHKGQKEIDCLDYLVYQIEKSVNENVSDAKIVLIHTLFVPKASTNGIKPLA